jgi:outer membrane protein TolC
MKITTICIVAACHAATLGAQAPQGARADTLLLTRETAIAAALASNPQLDVAREQTAQARARRVQAVAIPDPTFTYSYDNLTNLLKFGSADQHNAVFGVQIPFPDKFRLRNRIGTSDIQSAEYGYTGVRQQLAAQTATAYDALLVAHRHREIIRTSRDLAEDFLAKTKARFEGGTAAKLDVIRAQVAVAQAENDLIGAGREIQTASNALDRLIGQPVGRPIAARDSLTVPPALPDIDVLEQAALEARPEIGSVASQQAGAKATTSLAREFWLPDLTISAQRDFAAQGSTPFFSAGFVLPFPVFFWQHTKGEIAESKARERELAATYRDTRAQVSEDVRTSYAAADAALRQALYIRDALLPSAREAYRVASVSYGLGGSSALDVLDARRGLLDAETQYADALTTANSARADLERAAATPLTRFGARRTP